MFSIKFTSIFLFLKYFSISQRNMSFKLTITIFINMNGFTNVNDPFIKPEFNIMLDRPYFVIIYGLNKKMYNK